MVLDADFIILKDFLGTEERNALRLWLKTRNVTLGTKKIGRYKYYIIAYAEFLKIRRLRNSCRQAKYEPNSLCNKAIQKLNLAFGG